MYFRKISKRENFSFFEAHHYFTGYLISLVGFFLLFYCNCNVVSSALFLIGLWIVVDDYVQHFKQKQEIKKYGFYVSVSFWHWFPYLILYKMTKNEKYTFEF